MIKMLLSRNLLYNLSTLEIKKASFKYAFARWTGSWLTSTHPRMLGKENYNKNKYIHIFINL